MERERILVVDDDPHMRLLLEYNLKRRGYDVETAVDGPSAIDRALSRSYALIILDLMLPGFSGFQVCHRLRQEAELADIPIFLVTARLRREDLNEALSVGATEYLTKPFDPQELARRIELYLSSGRPSA